MDGAIVRCSFFPGRSWRSSGTPYEESVRLAPTPLSSKRTSSPSQHVTMAELGRVAGIIWFEPTQEDESVILLTAW